MTGKSDFTTDEWSQLIESTMLASVAITAADPHGLWGMLQEGWANAQGLMAARQSSTPLIKAVVEDLTTSEGRTIARDDIKKRLEGAPAADISARALTGLTSVAALLDAKAGADAGPFKQWIYDQAKNVAEAGTEGGFLGFGGVKVSDNEKATLKQIAAALKIG